MYVEISTRSHVFNIIPERLIISPPADLRSDEAVRWTRNRKRQMQRREDRLHQQFKNRFIVGMPASVCQNSIWEMCVDSKHTAGFMRQQLRMNLKSTGLTRSAQEAFLRAVGEAYNNAYLYGNREALIRYFRSSQVFAVEVVNKGDPIHVIHPTSLLAATSYEYNLDSGDALVHQGFRLMLGGVDSLHLLQEEGLVAVQLVKRLPPR